ncbi:hypothetical protein B0T22DRAFT_70693 [Podospora appendiculata]|uniref:Uncharacterized protein n=1 Tax=Podospora appendiculata TaxID=314037 RepID=A0AAE1CHL7_9PEZI|nr:hypothetical protein B0T22DRAFT_70693 [Podospora appendiculata]
MRAAMTKKRRPTRHVEFERPIENRSNRQRVRHVASGHETWHVGQQSAMLGWADSPKVGRGDWEGFKHPKRLPGHGKRPCSSSFRLGSRNTAWIRSARLVFHELTSNISYHIQTPTTPAAMEPSNGCTAYKPSPSADNVAMPAPQAGRVVNAVALSVVEGDMQEESTDWQSETEVETEASRATTPLTSVVPSLQDGANEEDEEDFDEDQDEDMYEYDDGDDDYNSVITVARSEDSISRQESPPPAKSVDEEAATSCIHTQLGVECDCFTEGNIELLQLILQRMREQEGKT